MSWILTVNSLHVQKLRDTSSKGYMGVGKDDQDPALVLTLGDMKVGHTKRQVDHVATADFNEEFVVTIDKSHYESSELVVICNNEGAFGGVKEVIGEGRILLKDVIKSKDFNTKKSCKLKLLHEGKNAGEVSMHIKLELPVSEQMALQTEDIDELEKQEVLEAKAAKEEVRQKQQSNKRYSRKGESLKLKTNKSKKETSPREDDLLDEVEWTVEFKDMSVANIIDIKPGAMIDAQDPMVEILLDDDGEEGAPGLRSIGKTDRIKDGGTSCTFTKALKGTLFNLDYEVTSIIVVVYNKGFTGGETEICRGRVNMIDAIMEEDINDDIVLRIPLKGSVKGHKDEDSGYFKCTAKIDAEDMPVPTQERKQARLEKARADAKKSIDAKLNDSDHKVKVDVKQMQENEKIAAGSNSKISMSNSKTAKNKTEAKKKAEVMKPFRQGILSLCSLDCSDLRRNKKDVVVKLEVKNSAGTINFDPQPRSNGHCIASLFDTKVNVERYHIHEGSIKVQLYEINNWAILEKEHYLGAADIPLDALMMHIDEDVHLAETVRDAHGTKVGHISLALHLKQTNDAHEVSAYDQGLEGSVLEVRAVKLSHLNYVESLLSSTVNHPFVRISYADGEVYTTTKEAKCKNGSVIYDHLTYEYLKFSNETVDKYPTIHVEVLDRYMGKENFIGSGDIMLKNLPMNEAVSFEFDLLNKFKVAGKACVLININNTLTDLQLDQKLASQKSPRSNQATQAKLEKIREKAIAEFSGGTFVIKSANVENIKNIETGRIMGDLPDPFVRFEFEDIVEETYYYNDVTHAYWDDLYYKFPVNSKSLVKSPLLVKLMEKNTTGSVVVGTFTAHLADYILDFDEDTDSTTVNPNYSFKIKFNVFDKDAKPAGSVTLDCMMKPTEADLRALKRSIQIDQSFEKGILTVTKILAKDLVSDLARDKQGKHQWAKSPYIEFDYCDNLGADMMKDVDIEVELQKTALGSGRDASWPVCDYRQRVTSNDLMSRAMTLYVKENNTKDDPNNMDRGNDRVISVGIISSMRLAGASIGNIVEIECMLYAPTTDFSTATTLSMKGSSMGELTLFCKVTDTTGKEDFLKPSPRLDDATKGEIEGTDGNVFKDGFLFVHKITATGLPQNPQVSYTIENMPETFYTTGVSYSPAETAIQWPVDERIGITREDLQRKAIQVTVKAKGVMGIYDVGYGEQDLSFFAKKSRINQPVDFTINVKDKDGKPCGRVIFHADVRPKSLDPALEEAMQFPKGFKGAIIHFTKIVARDLTNVEILGEIDPFIVLKDVNNKEIGRTFVQWDKGGNVTFDYVDIKTSTVKEEWYSADDIEKKYITIEAWDKNNQTGDKLIGQAVVRLKDLKGEYGREINLPQGKLQDKHLNSAGVVSVYAKLEEPPVPKNATVTFPDTFTKGQAFIRRIAGFGIKNVQLLAALGNRADPYLELYIYPSVTEDKPLWTGHTNPMMDIVGNHTLWDLLDLSFLADKEVISNAVLLVICKDKNPTAGVDDYFIGAGVTNIRPLAQSILMQKDKTGKNVISDHGKEIELSVELNLEAPHVNANLIKKSAGRLVFHMDVSKEEMKEADMTIAKDFEYGTLHIDKIHCSDLKNTELTAFAGGLPDPFVKFTLGEWKAETPEANNTLDGLWDFCAMETPCYLETIQHEKLMVEVWDKNLTGNTLIGRAECSIIKFATEDFLNQDCRIMANLQDKNGQPSGKIEIFGKLEDTQLGGSVPDDFQLGIMTVKKAVLLGSKGSTKHPSLTFNMKCGDKNQIHEVTDDLEHEIDPKFNLSLDFSVDKHTVQGAEQLCIDIHSKGMMYGETLWGSAKVELMDAALTQHLTKDTQLSSIVFNSKGQRMGRLVLIVNIRRDTIKALPITSLLPVFFVKGTLIISGLKITSKKYNDKKLFARIEYGRWNESTGTLAAGQNMWHLDFMAEANKDILTMDRLRVVLCSESKITGRVEQLAEGYATAKHAHDICANLKSEVSVRIDLIESNRGKKGKENSTIVGQAELAVKLTDVDMTETRDDGISDNMINFKSASLVISKISAYDLHGGDMLTEPDPYIILKLENLQGNGIDWTTRTDPQDSGGRTVKWEVDDINVPVTSANVCNKYLQVIAMDDNKGTGFQDVIMGSGEVTLKGAGADPNTKKTLVVPLYDKDKRKAGRVELEALINPDVDLSTHQDKDGDGIDDGEEMLKMSGYLQVKELSWNRKNVTTSMFGGASSYWCKIQFTPSMYMISDICTVPSNQTTWNWTFDAKSIDNRIINSVQLKKGVQLIMYAASGKEPNMRDKKVCQATVYAINCLNNLEKYIQLRGDFNTDGTFMGKYAMNACFVPVDHSKTELMEIKKQEQNVVSLEDAQRNNDMLNGPRRGDEGFDPSLLEEKLKKQHEGEFDRMRESHAELRKSMSKMEKSLSDKLTHMMDAKMNDMRDSVEDLERSMINKPVPKKKDPLAIFSTFNVTLPPDVRQWRTAHVQAWLAIVVELPAFMDEFLKASVDGMVLMNHIDEPTLQNDFLMTNAISRKKILAHIEELKERQEVIDRKSEAIRKATLAKEKAEADRELAKLEAAKAKLERETEKKKSKAAKKHKKVSKGDKEGGSGKGKKKSAGPFLPPTGDKGQPNEHNEIERVRLARLAAARLEEKRRKAAEKNKDNALWPFQYGDAAIDVSSQFQYANTDLFADALNGVGIVPQGKMRKFHPLGPIVNLPKNAQPHEVVFALQRAMYRFSEILLKQEAQKEAEEAKRNADDDLLSMAWSNVLEPLVDWIDDDAAGKEGPEVHPDSIAKEAVTTNPDWHPEPPSINAPSENAEKPSNGHDETKAIDGNGSEIDTVGSWKNHPPAVLDEEVVNTMTIHSPIKPSGSKLYLSSPSSPTHILVQRKHSKEHLTSETQPSPPERIELVYNFLVNQENNEAHHKGTIGPNQRLTRLKLLGACENLLRVRLTWGQFDTLWTNLTHGKELDFAEFKKFFGNLSPFDTTGGNNTDNNKAMKHLKYVLTELCDTVMNAGFTVMEMYECFDRNGNGVISYSEFCSLLRLIVGSAFDKRAIYTALAVLDTDNNKAISKEELFYFIYRFWRSKLDSLDKKRSILARVATANPHSVEAEKLNKLTKERMDIKDAIKKNFSRQMRDHFEANNDAIGGMFNSMVPQEETIIAQFPSPTQGAGDGMGTMANILSASAPMSLGAALGDQFLNSSQPASPMRTNSPIKKGVSVTSYNRGQIARFKIKAPGAASPTRGGMGLSLPHNVNVNTMSNDMVSAEKTEAMLRNSGGLGYD